MPHNKTISERSSIILGITNNDYGIMRQNKAISERGSVFLCDTYVL